MSGSAGNKPAPRAVEPEGATRDPQRGNSSYRAVPCAICAKMSVASHHPFCSRRCKDVDLHRWLGERYAVPARDDDWNE